MIIEEKYDREKDKETSMKIIQYYKTVNNIPKTVEKFNTEYNMSKNTIRKILTEYRKTTTMTYRELIEHYGGIKFIDYLVTNGYCYNSIAQVLDIPVHAVARYCHNKNYHWQTPESKHKTMKYKQLPSIKEILQAERYAGALA